MTLKADEDGNSASSPAFIGKRQEKEDDVVGLNPPVQPVLLALYGYPRSLQLKYDCQEYNRVH